jgi:2-dehydropantoate 2-reductase
LCTLQNGWGTDQLLLEAFPQQNLWVTTTTIAVGSTGVPTVGKGGVAAAQAGGVSSPPPSWLAQLGVPFVPVSDWRSLKWSKMLLNMVCNASCALLDGLPEEVVADPDLFKFELKCLQEALQVIRRLKIGLTDLPGYPVRSFALAVRLHPFLAQRVLGPRIAKGRGGKAPSFLVDMRAGRSQTEVGFLNGAVAREGARLGLATPANARITALLEEVSADPAGWERYRQKPRALAEALS